MPSTNSESEGTQDAKYEAENRAMLEHYGAVEVTVV
jgi:hypothetical protein